MADETNPLTTDEATVEMPTPEEETVNRWPGAKYGFHWGTGRRKSSSARVRLREGTGQILVNGKDYKVYFPVEQQQKAVEAPLKATETVGKYDVFVTTTGGGITGQAGAITMGLARALCSADQGLEAALRGAGQLTRDSRMKERKKPGQRGARRKFQFSKR